MNGYLTVLPVAGRENAGVGRSVLGFLPAQLSYRVFYSRNKLTEPACFLKGPVAWILRDGGGGPFAWVAHRMPTYALVSLEAARRAGAG